jgi:hypothetical protein
MIICEAGAALYNLLLDGSIRDLSRLAFIIALVTLLLFAAWLLWASHLASV